MLRFEEALNNHLEMVKRRNLPGFTKTVIQDERLILILPNGTLIEGFEAVKQFHAEWFSDPDWTLESRLIKTIIGQDLGTALLEVEYKDLDMDGEPYFLKYYLNLTFLFENEQWLLVFDQNTMLPK
jgi:hypothetical protein